MNANLTLVAAGKLYDLVSDLPEDALVDAFKSQINNVFGKDAVFFEKTKLSTLAGKKRIPDGYVLISTPNHPSWYIIEAELAQHGIDHIQRQVFDFVLIKQNEKVRTELVRYMRKQIQLNPELGAFLRQRFDDVGGFIFDTIQMEPNILVVIDRLDLKIEEMLASMERDGVRVIEFKVFEEHLSKARAHVFGSLRPVTVHERFPRLLGSNENRYTGTQPTRVSVAGKSCNVSTWRDVLLSTIGAAQEVRSSAELETLLELGGRRRKYFSRTPNALWDPKKVDKTDLYVETNLSAPGILRLCERILITLGLPSQIEVTTQ